MNELLSDTRFWFTTMGAAILGLIRVLWKRQERRLDALEADVTRKSEFVQLRVDMERRHEQSSEKLDKIESLIQRNHQDAVDGRHRVANQMLTLVEKVGTIEGRLGLDEFRRREG